MREESIHVNDLSVQLDVPDELVLGTKIQSKVSKGVIRQYFCYCKYKEEHCVFKYDLMEANRFTNDLKLFQLGISPAILFPTADDISEDTNYAIYKKIQTYEEFLKATSPEARQKKVPSIYQRLGEICKILNEQGFVIIDPNFGNFGFDEGGVLLFFDGVMKCSDVGLEPPGATEDAQAVANQGCVRHLELQMMRFFDERFFRKQGAAMMAESSDRAQGGGRRKRRPSKGGRSKKRGSSKRKIKCKRKKCKRKSKRKRRQ